MARYARGKEAMVTCRCASGSAWWGSAPSWVTITSGAKSSTAGAMTSSIART